MFGYQSYLFSFETHRIKRKKKKHHHISLQLSICQPPHGVPTELVIIPGIYIFQHSSNLCTVCMGDLIERTYCCRPQQASETIQRKTEGREFFWLCVLGRGGGTKGAFFQKCKSDS